MKKKPNKGIPAVTWVTLQPESSTRTSLKSVDEYLSEIQDDMPRPPRRLCLSPVTLKALESAERLVENAERQLSKMNFNSIINEELESEKFNGKANEEEKIYIRNVVASTLKQGFYDPASSVALAEHLRPSIPPCESHRPRSPPKSCRYPRVPREAPVDPRTANCLVCRSGKECRAVEVAPKPVPEPATSSVAVGDGPPPPERLTVHRAPDVSIKAELAVRTIKVVDIQPGESVAGEKPLDNVATFEVRHESVWSAPVTPVETQTPKPSVSSVKKQKVLKEKSRRKYPALDLTPPIEKRRKRRGRQEKLLIEDVTVEELSLTEPRILADIDTLLGRQREVMRQLNRFDRFFESKLPGELSSSNELEPSLKIINPVVAVAAPSKSDDVDSRDANSRLRELPEPEEKSSREAETSESNEDGSSTSGEVEIANIDYSEYFESASSVAATRSDAGFVEDLQEVNLDAGVREESQQIAANTPSPAASEADIEVNLEVEVDDESVDEDKDGNATEKMQESSQKTSHLIDSIPGTSPGKASNFSVNSVKLSNASDNLESTESKIESRISEVRGNLDSLLRSIDGSERVNNADVKSSDDVPKTTAVSSENRGDLDLDFCDKNQGLNQVDCANEATDKNDKVDDLANLLSKDTVSEKSGSQSTQSKGKNNNKPSEIINSHTNMVPQFPQLNKDTSEISIHGNNSNRSELNEVHPESHSLVLDDIYGPLEASLENDLLEKNISDKLRQSKTYQAKIPDGKSDQIHDNITVRRSTEPVGRNVSSQNLIVEKVQEIPKTSKALMKNDFVEMNSDQNSKGKDLHSKDVCNSLEETNRSRLIDRKDHRVDNFQKKQPIVLDEEKRVNREPNLSSTRSLITLLEENSEDVQQQKTNFLKILDSCSYSPKCQSKRVFTSTVIGDFEPSSLARIKESSQTESSSDTYSEGEVRFSSATSHSSGEIHRKNEFSKSSSMTKTASSGSYNPTKSFSHSVGEVSEIAVDSLG